MVQGGVLQRDAEWRRRRLLDCIRPEANTVPTSQAPSGGPNSANFYNLTTGFAVTGSTSYNPAQNYLTNVGAYLKSVSAYGTFDQGGDVFQWNEALIDSSRGLRGGLWGYYSGNLASSSRSHDIPTLESYFVGFRVASVPEPASIILVVCGAIGVLIWWRRRG